MKQAKGGAEWRHALLLSAQAEALRPEDCLDPVSASPRYDRGAPAPGSAIMYVF